jgi:hypothetical protein
MSGQYAHFALFKKYLTPFWQSRLIASFAPFNSGANVTENNSLNSKKLD